MQLPAERPVKHARSRGIDRVPHRFLPDEAATERLGDDIAAALRPGDVVALQGDLGAGKTTLARAIIRALADDPALEVPSPTYTLVQSYETRIPVRHVDLYRVAGADELEELGLDDDDWQGATLVEWPERAPGRFADAMLVAIKERGEGRQAEITARDGALARLSHSLAVRAFLEQAGRGQASRAYLLGDASVRAYETITEEGAAPLILMDAPERHDEPAVRDGVPYSKIARLAQSVTAFVAIAHVLRKAGFSAPTVFAGDLDAGLLLIEHLGKAGFLDDAGAPIAGRYRAAAALLARLHASRWPREIDISGVAAGATRAYHLPPYDRPALAIETELLLDWYFPFATGKPASQEVRRDFQAHWDRLLDRLEKAEKSMVLRDFHSPNIIWRDDREGTQRMGLIDIQDAVFGPAAYDVASLALDARVTIPADMESEIRNAYCTARRDDPGFDREAFEEAYAITAAQRNSKLLGTFVRLDRRDGKPGYLRHLPRIRDYLTRALSHPALADLRRFYEKQGIIGGVGG